MNLEQVINSQISLGFASVIATAFPPRLGYGIADGIADWIATRRGSEVVEAVRLNQWVVTGRNCSKETLDQSVRAVFHQSARSIYQLYHFLQDTEATRRLFIQDQTYQMLLNRAEFDQRGLILAGLHMSSFDLVLQWFCKHYIRPLVLTIPDPEGGRRMEFELRKKSGVNLVAGTKKGLRQALHHLNRGGWVATGIDRPIPESQHRPIFFGVPSSLPVHHIFLALKANVPVIVGACRLEEDGRFHLLASPPIEMDSYPNHDQELLGNAEKVLAAAELLIHQTPQQWSISLPVWPDLKDQVP